MTLGEFKKSKWCKEAQAGDAEKRIAHALPAWKKRVKHTGILSKAGDLWAYVTSGKATTADKALVLGALLYLISPIDLIPDAIPVLGWLDDIGLASAVLAFIGRKVSNAPTEESSSDQTQIVDVSVVPVDVWREFNPTLGASVLPQRLGEIRAAAAELASVGLIDAADALEAELEAPLLQVLFAGRYNAGKTSLLNALLGYPWLPVGPIPTTHAITYIMGGAHPTLVSQDESDTVTHHQSPDDLLDKNNAAIKAARNIVLTLPSPELANGIAFVDSPGLEDPDLEFSRLTFEAAPAATLIVLVLDATVLLSAPESEFVQGLLKNDRKRKMFVVINKADRLSASERRHVRQEAEKQLHLLDCAAPVFLLSAQEAGNALFKKDGTAPPAEFQSFQTALLNFVTTSLGDERRRYLETRLSGLEASLRAVCATHIANAEMDEKTRKESAVRADECRKRASEQTTQSLERLETAISRTERRSLANFQVFYGELESAVASKINTLGLDDLKSTDGLANFVREETRRFIERELATVHAELGEQTATALFDLQTGLQALSLRVQAPTITQPKPELIAPAMLVLTFPFLGIFSWVYLAVGVMLGRSVIDNLCSGLLNSVGLSKLRTGLLQQLTPKLKEFEQGVAKTIADHFNDLREIAKSNVARLASEIMSPMAVIQSTPTDPSKIALCRALLEDQNRHV
jgi:uncharacterized membrane protein YkvA (DUF1232 family)/predicted GTPase